MVMVSGSFGPLMAQGSFKKVGQSPMFPGGPSYPGFTSVRTQNGLLSPELQLQLDTGALQNLRQRALDTGVSPWGQVKQQQMQLAQQRGRDQMARQLGAQSRNVWNQVGRWNPELAARRTGQAQAQAMSGLAAQEEQARMGLLGQERAQQLELLRRQPGMELAALQPQMFNIQQALKEKRAEEQAKLASYAEQMKAYGASQTAGAIAQPQKKFLGLF
jgi:hypothetical protein